MIQCYLSGPAVPRRQRPRCSSHCQRSVPWERPTEPFLVDSPAKVQLAREALTSVKCVGIDTETRPSFVRGAPRNPPALLQVATLAGGARGLRSGERVFLFDLLTLLPEHSPAVDEALIDILCGDDVLVVGVDMISDVAELREWYPECRCFRNPRTLLDLGRRRGTRKRQSLRSLAREFAGVEIVKGRVQRSDWSSRPLSAVQLTYAANDARLTVEILIGAGSEEEFAARQDLVETRAAYWVCTECGGERRSRRKLAAMAASCSPLFSSDACAPWFEERQRDTLTAIPCQTLS